MQRHDISRQTSVEGDKPKKRFKGHPVGYVHIDIAEVCTEDGKRYMFATIGRVTKFAIVELHEHAAQRIAADFLSRLIEAISAIVTKSPVAYRRQ